MKEILNAHIWVDRYIMYLNWKTQCCYNVSPLHLSMYATQCQSLCIELFHTVSPAYLKICIKMKDNKHNP